MDLYADFGTKATTRDYLKSVVTPPLLKPFKKTEWADQHGTDYDTSNPVFEARTINIPFFANSKQNYQNLIAYLEQNIENKWHFEAINRDYMLRLTGSSRVVRQSDGWWFTLTFSEDKPMNAANYSPPMTEYITGCTVDGTDFGFFGVCSFLKGYIAEINKPFPIKQNLKISSAETPGLNYPDKNTYYGAKQVKLPVIFSRSQYNLQMLDSLVWKLTRPGYRTFADSAGTQFLFIYKGVQIDEFVPNEWLTASINLEFQPL
jgi:hypothetical protein